MQSDEFRKLNRHEVVPNVAPKNDVSDPKRTVYQITAAELKTLKSKTWIVHKKRVTLKSETEAVADSINKFCLLRLDLIELHEKLGMKLEIAQKTDSISERDLSVFGGAIY